MGFLRPLRYILLTDALLESLPQRQIEAVMAHELAHIRRHHIPWMMLLLLSAGALLTWTGGRMAGVLAEHLSEHVMVAYGWAIEWGLMLVAAGVWVAFFGCLSRRFERQADAFAVVHLSRIDQPAADEPALVTPGGVRDMSQALMQVALLNHMDVRRRGFRHGSIASRVAAMQRLAGRAVDDLPIDRTVGRLKALGVVLLVLAAALGVGQPRGWW
jgi:STE24 endopeptidase